MIIKVKFIEMLWDNYQGGSGKPIARSMLLQIPAETKVWDIENIALKALTDNGIKDTYDNEKNYHYCKLIKIAIIPTINSNNP